MLANYRCNEIKSQVLQENEGALREFYTMSIKGNLESFKELCLQLYDKILSQYDMIASNYVEKIYQSVRNQLKGDLYQKFLVCFHNQANRMIPISQKYMRHDLQIELKNSNMLN